MAENDAPVQGPDEFDEFDYSNYEDPYGSVTDQGIELSLMSWNGPSHIKKKATKRYYFNVILLTVVIALILIFVNQLYLLMMVLAIVFLLVVMRVAEPRPVKHVISNYGIYTGDHFYAWVDRGKSFWIEKKDGTRVLVVQTRRFPFQIVMLLNDKVSEEQIKSVLQNFLPYKEPKQNWLDKIINWWQRTFPLD